MSDTDSSSSAVPILLRRGSDSDLVPGLLSIGRPINIWTDHFLLYDKDGNKIDDPRQAAKVRNVGHRDADPLLEETWEMMGSALSENTVLREMRFGNCGLSDASITRMLFGEGRQRQHQHNYPLEVFVSQLNPFGARGLESLLPFLRGIPTLRNLGLNGADLGPEGVVLLSDALHYMHLTTLQLRDNNIGDGDVETLLAATNCRHLKTLTLHGNRIGRRGLDVISRFLQTDGNSLERLYITNNEPVANNENEPMDEECIKNFIDRLPVDSKLLTLNFGWTDGRSIDPALSAVPNLQKLVYNDAGGFDALCHQSNHTLRHVGVTENNDPKPTKLGRSMMAKSTILQKALGINAREMATDNQKLRSKLRTFYFRGQSFDLNPFSDIDIGLIPNLLEFVTMSEVSIDDGNYVRACGGGSLGGIYRLLCICDFPSLFGNPSPEIEIQRLRSEMSAMKREMECLRLENERLSSKLGLSTVVTEKMW
mmetsp:Transcript_16224/g.34286  ORF Transcript_16224/g.34286 Transcript_16224/m.34286 type:complete len:481 (-) Transcript_16224:127-1569(-)